MLQDTYRQISLSSIAPAIDCRSYVEHVRTSNAPVKKRRDVAQPLVSHSTSIRPIPCLHILSYPCASWLQYRDTRLVLLRPGGTVDMLARLWVALVSAGDVESGVRICAGGLT